jgi:cytochrome c oxidase assembly protein subunit 15
MTSLADTAPSGLAGSPAATPGLRAVRIWLFVIASLVLAMVVVGGATRLTGSGLSITEWKPILGAIPPLSEAAWQDAFEKYRQIPQYDLVNRGMSLEAFKGIYWWEWSHRFLGRAIGFVFAIPFAYFLFRRAIPKAFILPTVALFLLGGAQGGLGWFMVMSGLIDRVDAVSPYRLTAHLALATLIAAFAFWLGLSIRDKAAATAQTSRLAPSARIWAIVLCAAVYVQILAGGFVAGLKAGHASNTWPLMNGAFVPAGLDVYSPWYMNLFENPLTAQFVHRIVAYLIAIYAAAFAAVLWRSPSLRAPAAAIGLVLLLQIVLGIATIVYDVPLLLAVTHQGNAIVLFGVTLWALRRATPLRVL